MRSGSRIAKRSIDVVGSSVALALLSPIIAVAAVAIRADIGAPVLFRQQRAGLLGRPITVLKLRTMVDRRDERGELLRDAERLTPRGARVRRSSIDELPQLWSVLRGDMSLVGPRPLPLSYVDRYSAEQRRRLDVKPGITGWAQVQGRNTLSWPDRLSLDVWYVEHQSVRLDVRILLRTVGTVFGRQGVNAEGHATMHEFRGET